MEVTHIIHDLLHNNLQKRENEKLDSWNLRLTFLLSLAVLRVGQAQQMQKQIRSLTNSKATAELDAVTAIGISFHDYQSEI